MAVTVGDSVCLSDDEQQQAVGVREVAQVYELIKTQQPLLLLHRHPQQLAHGLLTEAMRALNVALSLMKHHLPPASASASAAIPANMIKAEAAPGSADGDYHVGKAKRSSTSKRRRISGEEKSSWVSETVVPHEDGYQWRKYGEKKIQGTHFTRSYFRCTYRYDKGCQATKQIQQKDDNYPPMFQVTYSNDHTCNLCTIRITDDDNNNNNNNISLPLAANPNSRPDDNSFSRIMIRQEPQAAHQLPPPLVVAAAAISNNQLDETPALHVYPEVPPTSKIYCSDGVAGTCSSNSSVISCHTDEFDYHLTGQQLETTVMEEALGPGVDLDDPYFDDQNLLHLYENLMNYY